MQFQSTVKKCVSVELGNGEKGLQMHTPPACPPPVTLSAELGGLSWRASQLDAVPERAPGEGGRGVGGGLEGWGWILRLQQSRQVTRAEARAHRRGWTE